MTTLSGILIDPFKKEISFHSFEYKGSSKPLYYTLGCTLFDIVTLAHGDSEGDTVIMFVDDEGLFKNDQRFFSLAIMPTTPFAGKSFIIKENKEGNLTSMTPSLISNVKMITRWLGDANGLEEAIKMGSIERPYSAFGTFDIKEDGFDGITKPKDMKKTWEWHPPHKEGE